MSMIEINHENFVKNKIFLPELDEIYCFSQFKGTRVVIGTNGTSLTTNIYRDGKWEIIYNQEFWPVRPNSSCTVIFLYVNFNLYFTYRCLLRNFGPAADRVRTNLTKIPNHAKFLISKPESGARVQS